MSKYDDEGWACFFLQHAGRQINKTRAGYGDPL